MASTSKDYTAAEVLTATLMDRHPQGVLGKATPITSNVGPTSGTTELDIITAPAVTIAATSRRLKLSFMCRGYAATVAGDIFAISIKEGATVLGGTVYTPPGTSVTGIGHHAFAIVDSPTVASHTYKVTIQRISGTGTATVSATATEPIQFIVEDVGQT